MSGTVVTEILERARSEREPAVQDIEALLAVKDPAGAQEIFDAADETRKRYMGDGILLRGIVEFGSFCANTCFYCGLHGRQFRHLPLPHERP